MLNDPRIAIERLCAERGEDFAGLSRMLGRNPAYIQQFVRRGVPKRLGEEERRKLARYFSIPESLLGGPVEAEPVGGLVPRHGHGERGAPGVGPGPVPHGRRPGGRLRAFRRLDGVAGRRHAGRPVGREARCDGRGRRVRRVAAARRTGQSSLPPVETYARRNAPRARTSSASVAWTVRCSRAATCGTGRSSR